MFSSFTGAGVIAAATPFVTEVAPVAMIAAGLGLAIGLTGWVIKRLRRASH